MRAKYDWFYLRCPFGPPLLQLLRAGSAGTAVGACGAGRRRMLWKGREIRAGVLVDLAVAREHRSLGPALMLQQGLVAAGHNELDLLYGFPNPKAAPVSGGWATASSPRAAPRARAQACALPAQARAGRSRFTTGDACRSVRQCTRCDARAACEAHPGQLERPCGAGFRHAVAGLGTWKRPARGARPRACELALRRLSTGADALPAAARPGRYAAGLVRDPEDGACCTCGILGAGCHCGRGHRRSMRWCTPRARPATTRCPSRWQPRNQDWKTGGHAVSGSGPRAPCSARGAMQLSRRTKNSTCTSLLPMKTNRHAATVPKAQTDVSLFQAASTCDDLRNRYSASRSGRKLPC